MPDERDIAQDKKALEQNEKQGITAEIEGEHPEHAPIAGKKTPQEHVDKDAIDESGNLIYEKETDDDDDEQ